MNPFQKFLSHLLFITIITTQFSPYSFADNGAIFHSLDELPSTQIEEKITTISLKDEPVEDITLLAEKREYDANKTISNITLPSLSNLLEQNSILWGMHDAGFVIPREQTVNMASVETFFPAGNFLRPQNSGVFKGGKERKFHVLSRTEIGDDVTGKFAKNPTNIRLSAGTAIQASDGSSIDPASI